MKSLTLATTTLTLALAAGCASKTPAPDAAAGVRPPAAVPVVAEQPMSPATAAAAARLAENLRRVHFGFDSAEITRTSADALAENAKILAAHPELVIEVEGHCDDRGTTEYNLALGQRRADAVRAYLTRAGARPEQVTSVTLGKERPLVAGESEAAWAENRRAEFRVLHVPTAVAVVGTTN